MAGRKVINLTEYKKDRQSSDTDRLDLPHEEKIKMVAERSERRKSPKKIHQNQAVKVLQRKKWEAAAKEILQRPVSLKQLFLKMLLKGVEGPDINLWWLYEWVKDGTVVELEGGLFQLAEYCDQKEE